METSVSVIVPMFNATEFVGNIIHDLAQQTFSNAEYLLIDDGSSDDTYQIAKQCVEDLQDSRFRIIKKVNGGVSSARNLGIKSAKGKYLIFIDADDQINRKLIEQYVETIENSQNNLEFFSVERIAPSGKHLSMASYSPRDGHANITVKDFIELVINFRAWAYPCSYISKRELWVNNNFPTDFFYQEDTVALFNLLFNVNNLQIGLNQACFYQYVQHNQSATKTMGLAGYNQAIKVADMLVQLVKETFPEDTDLIKRCNGFKALNILNYLREALLRNDLTAYQKKRILFLHELNKSLFSRKLFWRKFPFFLMIRINATGVLKLLYYAKQQNERQKFIS